MRVESVFQWLNKLESLFAPIAPTEHVISPLVSEKVQRKVQINYRHCCHFLCEWEPLRITSICWSFRLLWCSVLIISWWPASPFVLKVNQPTSATSFCAFEETTLNDSWLQSPKFAHRTLGCASRKVKQKAWLADVWAAMFTPDGWRMLSPNCFSVWYRQTRTNRLVQQQICGAGQSWVNQKYDSDTNNETMLACQTSICWL